MDYDKCMIYIKNVFMTFVIYENRIMTNVFMTNV